MFLYWAAASLLPPRHVQQLVRFFKRAMARRHLSSMEREFCKNFSMLRQFKFDALVVNTLVCMNFWKSVKM